jgi:hypothetical protein
MCANSVQSDLRTKTIRRRQREKEKYDEDSKVLSKPVQRNEVLLSAQNATEETIN